MDVVSVKSVLDEFGLLNLTPEIDLSGKFLVGPEVNRPALQLTGFFDFFESARLQIMGYVEHAYLMNLSEEARRATLERLFDYKLPCLVVCRNINVPPELPEIARQKDTPVLLCDERTSDFMAEVIKWLKVQLAPRMTIHGVLVDVYGEGILIMGESGIGKSETALELVKRGHRLVADDAVEIKKVSNTTLVGTCPDITRYLIELRGIGIVDIRRMFGVASVKLTQNIDLVIKLESWDDTKVYVRLGDEEETMDFMGNPVVCISIPVRPGRNLAIICESAAINHRLKRLGYNTAKELSANIDRSFNL
ncbi:MAG: HPr(Ser) kinase/phosphatase [Defluviitaleaceae bacterium]|nr:HPr(Ser) kinase/phosphatase [Defluviitaleaceae bacterium]